MITWLRALLDRIRHHAPAAEVVPQNPQHARTLDRADAVLGNPKIKRILSVRDAEMKASFARAGDRLGR